MTKTLMIQGTTSDVGKSMLVAGLGRVFHRRGNKVAPFKPQNFALNSAVTEDGGEIGRAQAVQAIACGVAPHTDMNPILLKPNTDIGVQVIIHGKAVTKNDAVVYKDFKMHAISAVIESYQRLSKHYDLILVEGSGSPAEINLRNKDIANMVFAEKIDCPVILIADIDKGGVFAHLIGTLELLSKIEKTRIKGFVINKFRGDITLLQSGLDWLEDKTNKPVLGVLPYLMNFHLESEDSIDTYNRDMTDTKAGDDHNKLKVIVPILPNISNHTDFDPLRLHPQVDLQFVHIQKELPPADLIILPGSKSVRADLNKLKQYGWQDSLNKHLRYGGKLLGICGGFQMLGKQIEDPIGIEGAAGNTTAFQLLEFSTVLNNKKYIAQVNGKLTSGLGGTQVQGYEIHLGQSQGLALDNPVLILPEKNDGAISEDNNIMGTYLHGLFENQAACEALLKWAGLRNCCAIDYGSIREAEIDRLADMIEGNLNWDKLLNIF